MLTRVFAAVVPDPVRLLGGVRDSSGSSFIAQSEPRVGAVAHVLPIDGLVRMPYPRFVPLASFIMVWSLVDSHLELHFIFPCELWSFSLCNRVVELDLRLQGQSKQNVSTRTPLPTTPRVNTQRREE